MKKFILPLMVLILNTGLSFVKAEDKFKLSSSDIVEGSTIKNEQVFEGFGCKGNNKSPILSWSGAPKETKSFALTMYDPDAPTGSGWWHWQVVNIPVSINSIGGQKLPAELVETRNDYGKAEYGGPCPPVGDKPHRYIFTIYALKTDKLDLTGESSGALTGYMINANKLAQATLTGNYGR